MIASRLLQGTPAGLPLDQCWPWQGTSATEAGYGLIYYTADDGRHTITAPRAMLALKRVVPFLGHRWHACHECDRPWCVNPTHVFVGTPKVNQRDMREKGRAAKTRAFSRRVFKLTDDDVRAIRRDDRAAQRIAWEHGISVLHVWAIKARRRKGSVPDEVGVE